MEAVEVLHRRRVEYYGEGAPKDMAKVKQCLKVFLQDYLVLEQGMNKEDLDSAYRELLEEGKLSETAACWVCIVEGLF